MKHIGKNGSAVLLLVVAAVVVVMARSVPWSGGVWVSKAAGTGLETGAQLAGSSGPAAYTLSILHTNDTWGYVDPCG